MDDQQVQEEWAEMKLNDFDNRADKDDSRPFCQCHRCGERSFDGNQKKACECQIYLGDDWNGRCTYQE